MRGDATRGRQMEQTWRAFGAEMDGAVRAALDGGRSPPEIAYAIGEIVHNYFRTRGVTLTSFELRRLVAELLAVRQRSPAGPEAALVAFTTGRAAPGIAVDGRRARPAGACRIRRRFRRSAFASGRRDAARFGSGAARRK